MKLTRLVMLALAALCLTGCPDKDQNNNPNKTVGATKPDPRIFQAALDALATSADRAVFIGDSLPRDMEGARRLGMRHIWLHPGAASACCPSDPVIASVGELLRVLP